MVPNRNGAVTSAVLVHLRVEPAHFDWRWRERPALALLAWEALARDPLPRLCRIQVESTGTTVNFRPAAITYRDIASTLLHRIQDASLAPGGARDRPTCTSEAGLAAAPPIAPRSLMPIITDKLTKTGRWRKQMMVVLGRPLIDRADQTGARWKTRLAGLALLQLELHRSCLMRPQQPGVRCG